MIVVFACCRRWRNNLNEPLNPFPFGWLLNKKAARVEVNISLAFLHWVEMALHPWTFVSDIAIFVLKGDVKLELTNNYDSIFCWRRGQRLLSTIALLCLCRSWERRRRRSGREWVSCQRWRNALSPNIHTTSCAAGLALCCRTADSTCSTSAFCLNFTLCWNLKQSGVFQTVLRCCQEWEKCRAWRTVGIGESLVIKKVGWGEVGWTLGRWLDEVMYEDEVWWTRQWLRLASSFLCSPNRKKDNEGDTVEQNRYSRYHSRL